MKIIKIGVFTSRNREAYVFACEAPINKERDKTCVKSNALVYSTKNGEFVEIKGALERYIPKSREGTHCIFICDSCAEKIPKRFVTREKE